MIRILWLVIGAVIGMIITALVSADETIQRRNGRIKYINYDAAMQEIKSYWIACKKDWKDDNCDLYFEGIMDILNDEVEYGFMGSEHQNKGVLEDNEGRG